VSKPAFVVTSNTSHYANSEKVVEIETMKIISSVFNMRFNHRLNGRSVQRTPMQIIAVAFAASVLALVRRVMMGVAGLAVLAMTAPPAGAQTHPETYTNKWSAGTYQVLTTNVPFKFKVGARTFKPGQYQFIVPGPCRLAIRDSHKHFIASLITRAREIGGPAPATKLVFVIPKKHPARLDQIWIENRSQVLDVVGEEVAMRQPSPVPAPMLPPDVNSLFGRRAAPGLKH